MLLHVKTRKKSLVKKFYKLGISLINEFWNFQLTLGTISYHNITKIEYMYSLSLKKNVFTTPAPDNIDRNPSSTSVKEVWYNKNLSMNFFKP